MSEGLITYAYLCLIARGVDRNEARRLARAFPECWRESYQASQKQEAA